MTPFNDLLTCAEIINQTPKTGDLRYRQALAFFMIAMSVVRLPGEDKQDLLADLSDLLDGFKPSDRAMCFPFIEVKRGRH